MDRQKDRREVWNSYLDNQKKVLAIWRKFYENNWPKNNLPAMASRITAINSTLIPKYNFIIGIVFSCGIQYNKWIQFGLELL